MSRRLEILRGIYEGMRVGDLEPWLAVIGEEYEWEWPPGMIEGGDVFRGPEGVRRGTAIWAEAWKQLAMEPQEMIERDDEVLVIVRYHVRGRTSGLEVDSLAAHLWRFHADEVVQTRMFANAERAKTRFSAGKS